MKEKTTNKLNERKKKKHFPLDRRIGADAGAEAHFPVHLIIFYVRFMIMRWEYEEPKAGHESVITS